MNEEDGEMIRSMINDEESVRILPPDYALKKKIGVNVNLREIFTPERITAAQKTIDDTQSDFIEWAHEDLKKLNSAHHAMEQDPHHKESAETMRKLAFSLKCQAGTFGFDLGSEVARSLNLYLQDHNEYNEGHIAVLRKHIDALEVIFQQNVQGQGGKIGEELMDGLQKLINKYN
jgi:chemotaxis protein histidine kinase CheA